eukprot:TRINITY_DN14136_c0_g1_i1.p1 TRINITY_DN14136_c0_g1~~TRINITY_DN14136_c0_g1_i1.p1  ORF type:complete len:296 (+),score=83.96 TRINITY_DN14136_c0_g1_i1:60-890(+)
MALTPQQVASFHENGYLVLPALLTPAEVSHFKRLCHGLVEKCQLQKTQTHWNQTGGMTLLTDSAGKPLPGLLHKVQSLCVHEPKMRELVAMPLVHSAVKQLMGCAEVDAFGSKFFPVLPRSAQTKGIGGYSVEWHQDNYFFGTDSNSVVSCGWYLEDTTQANGCFRVVPKSHKSGLIAPHLPNEGEAAGGEWIRGVDEATAKNIEVPAGSCVLFNAMIFHSANRNTSRDRSRYSCFWHYVPSDLQFAWRGIDFSRGKYEDRHIVTAINGLRSSSRL